MSTDLAHKTCGKYAQFALYTVRTETDDNRKCEPMINIIV